MKSYDELLEENRLLHEELKACREAKIGENVRHKSERLFKEEDRRDLYEKGSYFAFLRGNFRASLFYRLYRRVYRIFRPTMLIVRLIRWIMLFLTMVQASVVLLAATVVTLVMLPLIILLVLVVAIRIFWERMALRTPIGEAFRDKNVLVFFSSGTNGAFFDRNMKTLLPEYTVIVVQENGSLLAPAVLDRTGTKKRFLTACRLAPCYYRIRRHYFFYLRKRYFSCARSVSLVY